VGGVWRPLAPLLGVAIVLAACATVPERPSVSERPADLDHGQRVVAIAKKHVGAPYRWGGSSPSGFDCSGFVRYVYGQVGVELPHNAAQQYRLGTPVARDQLEPGDLVFFDGDGHVAMYVGNDSVIHAPTSGDHVRIQRIDHAPIQGYGRV